MHRRAANNLQWGETSSQDFPNTTRFDNSHGKLKPRVILEATSLVWHLNSHDTLSNSFYIMPGDVQLFPHLAETAYCSS